MRKEETLSGGFRQFLEVCEPSVRQDSVVAIHDERDLDVQMKVMQNISGTERPFPWQIF